MPTDGDDEPALPPGNKAFLAWLETVPDPERRYNIATSALEDYQEMVNRLSELRAGAVLDASEEDSVSSVARRFGVSRQRAHQLLQQAKARAASPTAKRRERQERNKNS
jgi:transposase-like protein